MIYMPNPQDYKDNYEMLIKKPTLANIDINNDSISTGGIYFGQKEK